MAAMKTSLPLAPRLARSLTPLMLAIVAMASVWTAAWPARGQPAEPSADARAAAARMGRAIPLEDPSGRALDSLHRALARAKAGKGQARLVFYGASHTASDPFTGVIRRGLQRRYGDAGHGFVLPARPWRYYRHDDLVLQSSDTWRADRIDKSDANPDGWYGLAGVSIASASPDDFGRVATPKRGPVGRRVDRFEVWTLEQPEGGTLKVRIDDGPWRAIPTAAEAKRPAYHEFDVTDGPHTLEVRPAGDGEVRLFGVVLERDRPGVVLDTIGIPGSRAVYHLQWHDALYREHLARRKPDLIALAYGTNEAGDDDVPIEDYERTLRQVMARIREVAPEASCLLIGPSDRPTPMPDGSWGPRPRTGQIVQVQRRVSADIGCAFFDTVAFMGGEMSMTAWVASSPPVGQKDHIHFTRAGYQRMGEVLLNLLLPPRRPRKAD